MVFSKAKGIWERARHPRAVSSMPKLARVFFSSQDTRILKTQEFENTIFETSAFLLCGPRIGQSGIDKQSWDESSAFIFDLDSFSGGIFLLKC